MAMHLEPIASFCGRLIVCPTIYKTDRDTAVVQGYRVDRDELSGEFEIPDGEDVVEVPLEVLQSAAKKLNL
jgi:hypothetical protein